MFSYAKVDYNSTATSYLCGTGTNAAALTVQQPLITGVVSGVCSPDFSYSSLSTLTAWNPHPTLEIGLDLGWINLNTANNGSQVTLATNGARPAGTYKIENRDGQYMTLRFQKTVLP